jgi:hypothetical protein
MDVYLIPVSVDRHELYCEVPDDTPADAEEAAPNRGYFARLRAWLLLHTWFRLRAWFREMLAEAERERRQARPTGERGWAGRAKARMMRWVAESIAEQRLLWHLRGQTTARLHYPEDLDEARAVAMLQSHLARDFDNHRFWLIIDGLGFVASGVFVLVPGPNVLAYYFAFRLVGHFFSLRGARQGLIKVQWQPEVSAPLAELRSVIGLAPADRERQLHDVAHRLHLEHLPSFFERTAIPMS